MTANWRRTRIGALLDWQWRALRSPESAVLVADGVASELSPAGPRATPRERLLVRLVVSWSVCWTIVVPAVLGVLATLRIVGDTPLAVLFREPISLLFFLLLGCAVFYVGHQLGTLLVWVPSVSLLARWTARGTAQASDSPTTIRRCGTAGCSSWRSSSHG